MQTSVVNPAKAIKEKIIKGMPVELAGKHARQRYKERLGVSQRKSVIRMAEKAKYTGDILSVKDGVVRILSKDVIFVFAIQNNIENVKCLFLKTVIKEDTQEFPIIRSRPVSKHRRKDVYCGKFTVKANFALAA